MRTSCLGRGATRQQSRQQGPVSRDHAQGQGEVDLTAIETRLRGKFQFIVRKDMKIAWPRGETPTHWMAMGLKPNLEEAMKMAVRETILSSPNDSQSFRVRRAT
jgi:acetamidase/formamidase